MLPHLPGSHPSGWWKVIDLGGKAPRVPWPGCSGPDGYEARIMIGRSDGYSVDTAAISGMPGFLVILVDENQRILSWNEAAADLFRVPAAQALGRSLTDVGG